ncbi:MAG: FG-GAP repeat protein [Polyangiaceae bacterium]
MTKRAWLNWSLKQGENFAVADIDGDGRSDLITNAPDGSVVLLAHGCVTP